MNEALPSCFSVVFWDSVFFDFRVLEKSPLFWDPLFWDWSVLVTDYLDVYTQQLLSFWLLINWNNQRPRTPVEYILWKSLFCRSKPAVYEFRYVLPLSYLNSIKNSTVKQKIDGQSSFVSKKSMLRARLEPRNSSVWSVWCLTVLLSILHRL